MSRGVAVLVGPGGRLALKHQRHLAGDVDALEVLVVPVGGHDPVAAEHHLTLECFVRREVKRNEIPPLLPLDGIAIECQTTGIGQRTVEGHRERLEIRPLIIGGLETKLCELIRDILGGQFDPV